MRDLKGKQILLTGAAGGIGSEVAKALSAEGAQLILTDRNELSLAQLKVIVGEQHQYVAADISSRSGRKLLSEYCENHSGQIDIVINLAGINRFASLADFSEEEIEQLLHVNLFSQIALVRMLLPQLLKQSQASIINFGSTLGSIGFPGYTIYSASKFGLRGFTEALRRELLDTSVSVRYFAPRAARTALNTDNVSKMNAELGTAMDKPEDVAAAFVSFLKGKKAFYYLGWPEKLFVRINGLLPGLVDKSIFKQLPVIKKYL